MRRSCSVSFSFWSCTILRSLTAFRRRCSSKALSGLAASRPSASSRSLRSLVSRLNTSASLLAMARLWVTEANLLPGQGELLAERGVFLRRDLQRHLGLGEFYV